MGGDSLYYMFVLMCENLKFATEFFAKSLLNCRLKVHISQANWYFITGYNKGLNLLY